MEHREGIEPSNTGFADQRVSHFATGAHVKRIYCAWEAPSCFAKYQVSTVIPAPPPLVRLRASFIVDRCWKEYRPTGRPFGGRRHRIVINLPPKDARSAIACSFRFPLLEPSDSGIPRRGTKNPSGGRASLRKNDLCVGSRNLRFDLQTHPQREAATTAATEGRRVVRNLRHGARRSKIRLDFPKHRTGAKGCQTAAMPVSALSKRNWQGDLAGAIAVEDFFICRQH
jgi:hypothetical protein